MDKISGLQDSRIVAAGIDAAKSTFSVCGVDCARSLVLERTMNRARLLALFADLPPCTVGLEACSGAHQLVRELAALGHTVRIIAAKFVAPHRISGKNDRNDARAIVDALLHPRTRSRASGRIWCHATQTYAPWAATALLAFHSTRAVS